MRNIRAGVILPRLSRSPFARITQQSRTGHIIHIDASQRKGRFRTNEEGVSREDRRRTFRIYETGSRLAALAPSRIVGRRQAPETTASETASRKATWVAIMNCEYESFDADNPRSKWGWLKFVGWGMLLLAFLVAAGMTLLRVQGAGKLQDMLTEMDRTDPGWRIENIEAAREEVPEGENNARVVMAAAERMPPRWPSADFHEEDFRLGPPNEKLNAEGASPCERTNGSETGGEYRPQASGHAARPTSP